MSSKVFRCQMLDAKAGCVNITETTRGRTLLVRSGPYAIVRHPIYSGFMVATLGTPIAFGEWSGLFAFLLIAVAWGYKGAFGGTRDDRTVWL